ncbi:MAG: D-alanine--D-alanine ligase [Planctomycetota bacterium]|nr:D-alanine--D-alanine ligase [Planctomycetota bacterium]
MDVAVLAGGRSPEHDISLASARQVLTHLDRSRWRVWPVYIDREGRFWPAREPLAAAASWQPEAGATGQAMRPGAALEYLLDHAQVEIVFPVLHGPFGEDGTVQGMLELYGLPFVGSGCAASAVAMDKLRTRQVFAANDLPLATEYLSGVPVGELGGCADEEFARMIAATSLPCYAKVDNSGSSRGVARITDRADFERFLRSHAGCDRRWLAEAEVTGEEITVAVLGNRGDSLQALPVVGIYPRFSDHFDERAKYDPDACEELVPPKFLSAEQGEHAQEIARTCHRELGCDGMSRTDMIWTSAGPVVLETNTIPGLTETSLLPQAAAAAGIGFPQLLDRLLQLGLACHRRPSSANDRSADGPSATMEAGATGSGAAPSS